MYITIQPSPPASIPQETVAGSSPAARKFRIDRSSFRTQPPRDRRPRSHQADQREPHDNAACSGAGSGLYVSPPPSRKSSAGDVMSTGDFGPGSGPAATEAHSSDGECKFSDPYATPASSRKGSLADACAISAPGQDRHLPQKNDPTGIAVAFRASTQTRLNCRGGAKDRAIQAGVPAAAAHLLNEARYEWYGERCECLPNRACEDICHGVMPGQKVCLVASQNGPC